MLAVTRRRALIMGAGAVTSALAGCAGRPLFGAAGRRVVLRVLPPVSWARVFPQLTAAYGDYRPQVALALLDGPGAFDVHEYEAGEVDPQALADLGPALRLTNFQLDELLPTAQAAVTWSGRTLALPVGVGAFGWLSNPSVWASMDVPAPDPGWDGASLLATLAAAAKGGPPAAGLIGGLPYSDRGAWGSFLAAGGAPAFVGGRCVVGGDACVAALQPLVATAGRYGWRGAAPAKPGGSALAFAEDAQVTALMPVPPAMLLPFPNMGRHLIPGEFISLAVRAGYEHVDEAVMFIRWLYGAERQALLASTGQDPVLAAPAVWSAWKRTTVPAQDGESRWWDPAVFANIYDSWPPLRPAGVPPGKELWSPIDQALVSAVAAPSQLQTLLRTAQDAVNGYLATA